MLYLSGKIKKFEVVSGVLVISTLVLCVFLVRSFYEDQLRQYKMEAAILKETLDRIKVKISTPRYPFATSYERKDYNNYELMHVESSRTGPGEHGKSYILKEDHEIEKNKEILKKYGYSGVASDHISVNRSLPDMRLSAYVIINKFKLDLSNDCFLDVKVKNIWYSFRRFQSSLYFSTSTGAFYCEQFIQFTTELLTTW